MAHLDLPDMQKNLPKLVGFLGDFWHKFDTQKEDAGMVLF